MISYLFQSFQLTDPYSRQPVMYLTVSTHRCICFKTEITWWASVIKLPKCFTSRESGTFCYFLNVDKNNFQQLSDEMLFPELRQERWCQRLWLQMLLVMPLAAVLPTRLHATRSTRNSLRYPAIEWQSENKIPGKYLTKEPSVKKVLLHLWPC